MNKTVKEMVERLGLSFSDDTDDVSVAAVVSGYKGDMETVAALISSGILDEAKCVDLDGNSPLHHLMTNDIEPQGIKRQGSMDAFFSMTEQNKFRFLQANKEGNAPIHLAMKGRNFASIKSMLKISGKSGLLARGAGGNSLFHLLAKRSEYNLEYIIYPEMFFDLVKSAALTNDEINQRNDLGETPLMLCENAEDVKNLISLGADIDLKDNDGGDCFSHWLANETIKSEVEEMIARTGRKQVGDDMSFLGAAKTQNAATFKKVLKERMRNGGDLNVRNSDGQTAFMVAVDARKWASANELLKAGVAVKREDLPRLGKALMKIEKPPESYTEQHARRNILKIVLDRLCQTGDTPFDDLFPIPANGEHTDRNGAFFDWEFAFSFAGEKGIINEFIRHLGGKTSSNPLSKFTRSLWHDMVCNVFSAELANGTLDQDTIDFVCRWAMKTGAEPPITETMENRYAHFHELAVRALIAGGDIGEETDELNELRKKIKKHYKKTMKNICEGLSIEGDDPYEAFSQSNKLRKNLAHHTERKRTATTP